MHTNRQHKHNNEWFMSTAFDGQGTLSKHFHAVQSLITSISRINTFSKPKCPRLIINAIDNNYYSKYPLIQNKNRLREH